MVEILIAAVLGGLVGAFGTAAWLRRRDGTPARERRSGGAAAALQRSILDSLQDGVVVSNTIPVSGEAPLPALPISFPNLATYLASALEHSRSAMHDSSSGVRRLAKLIDQFYPNDRVALDDAPERMGMRRRLKNLVGIGRPQRDRNAEMYELVTPFVPDEHGR